MKKQFIEGTNLYVACVRCITKKDEDSMEMHRYNQLGYRLFYKKNEHAYVDLISGITYPTFKDNLVIGTLFILNAHPLFKYAHSLRLHEKPADVMKYAEYIEQNFTKDRSKWAQIKDYIHKVHHEHDDDLTK